MIVIPAILVAIAEAAFIGGLAGAVICGMEDKRTLSSDAPKELRTAHKCAAEGALVGGIFGAGGAVVGFTVAGSAVDDFALSASNSMDDAARLASRTTALGDDFIKPTTNALDDMGKPAIRGLRPMRNWFGTDIYAPLRREHNISRASFYKSLRMPKNAKPLQGYGYVVRVKNVSKKPLYKIGRTTRPSERLGEIQTNLNKTVGGTADYVCIMSAKNMFQLESKMHAVFESQRIRNFAAGSEFFNLNAAQVAAACSY